MSDAIWQVIADGGLALPYRRRPRARTHTSRDLVEALRSLVLDNVDEASLSGEFSIPHEGAYNADGWVRGRLVFSAEMRVKREGSESGIAVGLSGEGVELSRPLASAELFGGEVSLDGTVAVGPFAHAVASGNRRRIAQALLGGVSLGVKWEEAGIEVKFEPDEDLLLIEVAVTPTLLRSRHLFPFRYRGRSYHVECDHLTVALKLGPGNQLLRAVAERVGPELVALVAEEGSVAAVSAWAIVGLGGSLAFFYGGFNYLESVSAVGVDNARMIGFSNAYVWTAFAPDRRCHEYPFEPAGQQRAVADMVRYGQAEIQRLLAVYFNNRRPPNGYDETYAIRGCMGKALINHREHRAWDYGIEGSSGFRA